MHNDLQTSDVTSIFAIFKFSIFATVAEKKLQNDAFYI